MGVWIETTFYTYILNTPLVTPCMGVWIETANSSSLYSSSKSHPVWVCGLKPKSEKKTIEAIKVTPCMGVWIETPSGV